MLIYLIIFFIVVVISNIAEKMSPKNKKLSFFLVMTIILILSALGGLRATDIGTDIGVYGKRWFEYACKSKSFGQYSEYVHNPDIAYIYLNYIVSRFTNDFNVFLFVLQLICNGLVIMSLYKSRKDMSFTIATLLYITLFYCRSYNYLRQSIALAIVFYAFKYVEKKKLIKYIVATFLAGLFHFTAYIAFIIYPIYHLLKGKSRSKNIIVFLIVAATIAITVNIVPTLKLLYNLNIISYRVYMYIYDFSRSSMDISVIETAFKVLFIALYSVNLKKLKIHDDTNYFLLLMMLIDIILFQIRSIILYTDRIALYFGYFIMITLSRVHKSFSEENDRKLIIISIFAVSMAFWIFKFVFENSGEVYPYRMFNSVAV